MTKWTADDFPSNLGYKGVQNVFFLPQQLRESIAAWLNEHEPKPKLHTVANSTETTRAVTRDDIDGALINVTSNAMNYPTPSEMLGKDSGPLRRKCVDAVCDLLGIEAEQAVDPVEEKAREWAAIMWPGAHLPDGDGAVTALCRLIHHLDRQGGLDDV